MKKKFRTFELVAKKYLEAFSSGIHSTLLKDSLIDVDVVREYQPGDKRLDSKSSLRTGKTMSRVFNPERSLNLFIILDISSSQYTKIEVAIIAALYLCYLGEMCSEKVGLCVFSNHIASIIEATDDYSYVIGTIEKSWNSLKMESITNIDISINRIANLSLTNSLVVLISDFCYPLSETIINNIKKISVVSTNSFLSTVLYNPMDWLMLLDQKFSVTFRDAETGQIGNCYARSAKKEFIKWSDDIKVKLMRCSSGAVFLDVKQKEFLLPLVKHLMRLK